MIDKSRLQSYPCPVCSTEDREKLYEVKGFGIVRCRKCGMVYVDPRIHNDNIFDLYTSEYFHRHAESGYENYELTAHLRVKTFRKWYHDILGFLAAHGRSGPIEERRALDIGCAAGYFLDILRKDNWQAEGIELDKGMVARLREKGFKVHDRPLEQFNPPHTFDLITLFDVLEHLPDVNSDFGTIGAMLSDEGIVALVTPDFGSMQRKLFGKRWFQYKPYEHIYYFSKETLGSLAEKHGFEIVRSIPSGQYADFSFLHNRLAGYGFPLLDKLFCAAVKTVRLEKASWYADTGSMFVIMKKKQ